MAAASTRNLAALGFPRCSPSWAALCVQEIWHQRNTPAGRDPVTALARAGWRHDLSSPEELACRGSPRRSSCQAAITGVRWNPVLKTFFQRKLQQGLAKKSALVTAMRKLLHLVYGVLHHQQPFNPQHEEA